MRPAPDDTAVARAARAARDLADDADVDDNDDYALAEGEELARLAARLARRAVAAGVGLRAEDAAKAARELAYQLPDDVATRARLGFAPQRCACGRVAELCGCPPF